MSEHIKCCGDCIHAEICKQVNGWFSPKNIAYCTAFKNAADVVEVKHGNWSIRCKTHHDTHTGEYDEEFYLECSSCGREVWDIDPADVCNYGKLVAQFPYCHCGAKMDGE